MTRIALLELSLDELTAHLFENNSQSVRVIGFRSVFGGGDKLLCLSLQGEGLPVECEFAAATTKHPKVRLDAVYHYSGKGGQPHAVSPTKSYRLVLELEKRDETPAEKLARLRKEIDDRFRLLDELMVSVTAEPPMRTEPETKALFSLADQSDVLEK